MAPASSFVALALVLGSGMSASALHTLPVRKIVKEGVVNSDRARMAELAKKAHSKRGSAVPVTNSGITYLASVGIGSPPTQYTLQVDTGSANIWVGFNKTYVKTNTSINTGDDLSLSYGDGTVYGFEYLDEVTLAPGLVIANQSVGVSNNTGNFAINAAVDGIMGIGLTSQTTGSVTSPDGSIPANATVPTVTDNLYAQGKIDAKVVGIQFAPSSGDSEGSLTFGEADTSKYLGSITYTPSNTGSWYISQNITYGNTTILSGSGIVDTGTIMVYMSINEFEGYLQNSGGSYNTTENLISFTPAQYAALKPLNFIIGGGKFTLSANAQIWPRKLNSLIGGEEGEIYSIVSTFGNELPFNFILGYSFLERFYSVFDTTNSRIGFAPTKFTNATTN
ncbi:hypothetical protein HWV62_39166 [Athelia sp. TMB]|nr:hypothetical protein HWV62_39166 [Athelia sp. TMB]